MKVIADFNTTGFERILAKMNPAIRVDPLPYGQFMQSVFQIINEGYDDIVLLWLDFSSLSEDFARALAFEAYDQERLYADLEDYASLIEKLAGRVKGVIVANFVMPAFMAGGGLSALTDGQPGFLLAELNLRLYKAVSAIGNAWCIDQTRWFHSDSHYNGKLYHAGKIPFSQMVLQTAARDVSAALNAIGGRAKKLLVLDLDNTLWGGILGDDGVENLKLGAPGAVGEAFVQFQREVRALKNLGFALAIASKNYEDNALEAIRSHPEMQLKLNDFSAWRINWNDKAANIVEIANELNLGLDSVVFIDDNPAERARVAEALPDVFVPQWPEEPCNYVAALRKLSCFSVASVSQEDRNRVALFRQEKQRTDLLQTISDRETWLKNLQMRLEIEPAHDGNMARVVQLLNKTNQFNLRTRRMTQGELERWLGDGNTLLTFRVSDRFGDMGLIGLLGMQSSESGTEISDFVMSCRVMGRDIEKAMLQTALRCAQDAGHERVRIRYEPTKKNRPVFDFMKAIELITDDNHTGWLAPENGRFGLDFFQHCG